ncbi:MAG TPA: hypothetical protein VKP30_22835 [Polyangiaceae bacterium]|nr:hypothetical protein [Polyangiaceae bacterium]
MTQALASGALAHPNGLLLGVHRPLAKLEHPVRRKASNLTRRSDLIVPRVHLDWLIDGDAKAQCGCL